MSCPNCAALRAQVAELKEELAAWKAYDEGHRHGPDPIVADRWRAALNARPGATRIIMALAARPDRLFSREAIIQAAKSGVGRELDEPCRHLANVYVCHARTALAQLAMQGRLSPAFAGPAAGIKTHWGHGYSMTPAAARELERLVEVRRYGD